MTERAKAIALLLGAVMTAGAAAQDADDIGPAVDTSAAAEAPAPAVDTSAPAASGGRAMDSLSLDTSQVIGNQELPQVLYIVPWKSSDLGDLVGRPVNTLLDEVLAPADREVFLRQVRYYEDLHGDAQDDS